MISVDGNTNPCPNEGRITLRVTDGDAPYRWFKNGVLDAAQTGPIYLDNPVAADAGTTVTYSVEVTDPGAGSVVMLSQNIDVPPLIQARIDGPDAICEDAAATFNVVQADGTPFPAGFSFLLDY